MCDITPTISEFRAPYIRVQKMYTMHLEALISTHLSVYRDKDTKETISAKVRHYCTQHIARILMTQDVTLKRVKEQLEILLSPSDTEHVVKWLYDGGLVLNKKINLY